MRNFIMNKLYHPVLFFFLLPVFYIALGTLFSLQYNALNFTSLILFYFFVFLNQMLENMFLRIPTNEIQLSKSFVLALEGLILLILVYFGFRHSWIASSVLLCLTLILQLQFLFSYYDLDYLSVLVTNFFKVILLNGFAFYIGTSFIQFRFSPYYFGLFIPFYLYEASRIQSEMKKLTKVVLIGASYLIGIGILWQPLGWWSLLLLLSLPFSWLLVTDYNRKTSAIYTIFFSIFYISLIAYTLFG